MTEFRFIPLLVTLEINLLLGGYVLATRRGEVWARAFAAIAFAVAVWCAGWVAYFFSGRMELALKLSLLGMMAVPAALVYYLASVHGVLRRWARPAVLISVFLAASVLAGLPWQRLGLSENAERLISLAVVLLYVEAGYLCFFFGSFRLAQRTPDEKLRRQLRFELWATLLPFYAILIVTLLSLVVGQVKAPSASLAVVLGGELVLYSFLEHGRVKADRLLSEGMAYLAYLVLITGVVSILLFFLDRIPGVDFTSFQVVLVLVLTALSAIIAAGARDRVRLWVDRSFFPEKYEYQALIQRYQHELDEMQKRLNQAERLAVLGEVAASVAHEIRNPLGPIKGYAQMLMPDPGRQPPSPELLQKGLAIIAEEVKKIDARVERLLQFARPAAAARETVDLKRLLEQTAALFRFHPAFSAGLDIRVEGEDGLSVQGERGMLESALFNLLLNAAQACSGRGAIRLRSFRRESASGRRLLLEVSDNGPGMAAEVLEKLFEPFFTRRPGGVGLGLCIVKRVAEDHGGKIEVQSAPGQGAVFTIDLPDQPGRGDRTSASTAEPPVAPTTDS